MFGFLLGHGLVSAVLGASVCFMVVITLSVLI